MSRGTVRHPRWALVAGLLLVVGGCGNGGDDRREPSDDKPAGGGEPAGAERIEPFLDGVIPEGSSGTLVAGLDGDMVACRGWGEVDHAAEAPAGCDTVYDIGSITKQFTAAAVLKLQMQDRLKMSDPIGAYLDAVPADKRDITVHQLLTHTSGLVDTLGGDYERLSKADLVTEALDSELLSEPGEKYRYSNVGYSLLGAIIEKASGMGYEEYLAEQLFGPTGMTRTGYVLPDWEDSDVAVEYDAGGAAQGRPFDHPWAEDGPYWNLRANGGLLSTARDMFRWHLALEEGRILDASALRQLFEPRVREEPGGDTFYAYGWVVQRADDRHVLWHNGGNGLSYGEIARIPDAGAMVFWVTNQARSKDDWDLEKTGGDLTGGVLERLLKASADGT